MIERAAEAGLARLAGNPRLSDDLRQRIQRGLRDRVADARVQVQAFISNAVITPGGRAPEAGTPAAARAPRCRRVRRAGAPGIGVACRGHAHGAATAADGAGGPAARRRAGAHITDYKTGADSPIHAEQLRLYALLWNLDRDANPARRPVASLTAAYPGRDATIPVPGEPELRDIEKQIAVSIGEADAELAATTPRAVPSAENCGNCGVRHLCDAYWSTVAPDPSDLPDDARFDCQGTVGTRERPAQLVAPRRRTRRVKAAHPGTGVRTRTASWPPHPDPWAANRRGPGLDGNRGVDERADRGIPAESQREVGPYRPIPS